LQLENADLRAREEENGLWIMKYSGFIYISAERFPREARSKETRFSRLVDGKEPVCPLAGTFVMIVGCHVKFVAIAAVCQLPSTRHHEQFHDIKYHVF